MVISRYAFLLFFILILSSNYSSAQIAFEEAYYITNRGERVDGLIKNMGWKKNPTSFQFKPDETAIPQSFSIKEVSQFVIMGQLKYIRAEVPVDQSTDTRFQLTNSMVPEFEPDTVFLKVLLEGDASLFELQTETNTRYYFQVDGNVIEPLVYKKFFISATEIRTNKEYQKIRTNKEYQKQIQNNLHCNNIDQKEIEDLEYKKQDLFAVFQKFNECVNSDFVVYKGKKAKRLNISIGARVYQSSLNVTSKKARDNADFGTQSAFTFDVEAEAFLPFNNNQWSLIVGITPQKFSNTVTTEYGVVSFKHQSINVPTAIRFNKYLNPNTRWYLQTAMILTLFGETDIQYDFRNGANDTVAKPGFSFAAGFVFRDIINAQFEIEPRRQLFALATSFETAYRTASLSISYQLPF